MHGPEQRVRLRSSARTDTGRVRDNNEDTVHLWPYSESNVIAIVADGMGGAVAGEEASRIAVETIIARLSNSENHDSPPLLHLLDEETINEQLQEIIRNANNNIVEKAVKQPELKGMGTTVTMAFIHNTSATLAHVGDSRAYLIDGLDGHISQITSDHSFVQALVSAGHITSQEAEEHPMRNVLYRALGQSRDVDVDIYYQDLNVGDRLVLCSDGLTLHVKPHEIAELTMEGTPEEASQRLVDLANERGGRDNVTVIVVEVEESTGQQASTDQSQDGAKNGQAEPPPQSVVPPPNSTNAGIETGEHRQHHGPITILSDTEKNQTRHPEYRANHPHVLGEGRDPKKPG